MSFTGRDLGLALSEDVGDAMSMRYTTDDTADTKSLAPAKPKLDLTRKVLPYRSGKAPVWHQEDEDEGGFLAGSRQSSAPAMSEHFLSGLDAVPDGAPHARRIFRAEVVESRPAAVDDEGGDEQDDECGGGATLAEPDDESEDEIARRRALLRERLRRKQLEDTEGAALTAERDKQANEEGAEDDDDDDDEESSSEYETGSEDEVAEPTERLKPIFVPKGRRETVTAAEQQAAEEAAKDAKKRLQAEERKRETRDLVAETIRREEEQNEVHLDGNGSEADMPDDADVDEESPEFEVEFEVWKTRELARRRRDASERELMQKEQEETERRRRLTDEERLAEDRAAGKLDNAAAPGKPKWKFLQKYYHKGAFYMDDESLVTRGAGGKEDVRKREYDAPTLEDKYDKSALPAVMQVKKFGFAGRTKYTHLADQDTTAKDNPMNGWMNRKAEGAEFRRAGTGDITSAGRKRKLGPGPG